MIVILCTGHELAEEVDRVFPKSFEDRTCYSLAVSPYNEKSKPVPQPHGERRREAARIQSETNR